jgi:hypothetical protein
MLQNGLVCLAFSSVAFIPRLPDFAIRCRIFFYNSWLYWNFLWKLNGGRLVCFRLQPCVTVYTDTISAWIMNQDLNFMQSTMSSKLLVNGTYAVICSKMEMDGRAVYS